MTGPALLCAGLLGVVVIASVALRRTLMVVTVCGSSMAPTYHDGDRVLACRRLKPTAGRVVVVEWPRHGLGHDRPPSLSAEGKTGPLGFGGLIKRVAGAPGDPIPRDQIPALRDVPEEYVPPGKLILLGDNGVDSLDSRTVGYFAVDRVLGTVLRFRAASRSGSPRPYRR